MLWGNFQFYLKKHDLFHFPFCFSYSYLVHIDENGDAAGNYTILGLLEKYDDRINKTVKGMFPIGTFITGSSDDEVPVSFSS